MSTKWVVTAAAERIVMSEQRRGETTFTVTNPSGSVDRAVFDAVPGEGAEGSWFTVEEPQRLVRPGASVSYLLKVVVPADTAPGSYAVQGQVYSADSAPEESSVLSQRVVLEVPPEPEPTARRRPWWLWAVLAALVVIIVVVVALLVGGGDRAEPPPPSPAPGEVVMPDLLGMTERDALRALAELGLTVRPIDYLHDPERADTVVLQSPLADTTVAGNAVVDLDIAVDLAAPTVTGPAGVPVLLAGEPTPTLEWDPGRSPARRWQVELYQEECLLAYQPAVFVYYTNCGFPDAASATTIVDAPTLTPELAIQPNNTPVGTRFHSGWVRWRVSALDDFDNPGPATDFAVYLQRTH
jgi:hypothetical protein